MGQIIRKVVLLGQTRKVITAATIVVGLCAVVAAPAVAADYPIPPPAVQNQQQQQQAAASEASTLAQSISNPVAKQSVLNAVTQSNGLINQSNALLLQAQKTTNPVVKAHLEQAALVAATAAKVLALLAKNFAAATLRAEGKAADVARAHAVHAAALKKPSPQAVQKQLKVWLAQVKVYANNAKSLLKQAAKLLRGHPSKKNQQKAGKLIALAKKDVGKAQVLNAKAKALVASSK